MVLAWRLFLLVVKRRLAYRGDLLLASLDEMLRGALALTMLEVYAARTPDIAGWSHAQLVFILGFSLVPISLFHTLCGNLYQLSSHYLIGGNFDRVLLRPYPTFLQVCFDRISIEDLSGAILGVVLMVIAAVQLPNFAWDPGHVLALVVLQASAFAVVVAVFMAFAATGFWFEDRVGMVPPVYNLMEFGRWPNRIYHPVLRFLITCVIPFSFVAFYPASLLVDGQTWWPALATPVVAVVAVALAAACWKAGVARYASSGS